MKTKLSFFAAGITCLLFLLTISCKKDPSKVIPTLTTTAATNITPNSATCGGTISFDGNSAVTSRGVCWGTNQSPTINDSKTTDESIYEGEWKNDKRNGYGILTSGDYNSQTGYDYKYEGYFKDYLKDSLGVEYNKSELYRKGFYKYDKQYNGEEHVKIPGSKYHNVFDLKN